MDTGLRRYGGLMNSPIIILSHPQMGENIGAAARVMKNFGLHELRLVKPRDGWPNPAAISMAAGGADIIAAATLYDSTREAVADCHHVLATTARSRAMTQPVMTAKEVFGVPRAEGAKTAILFGCEKSGLDNEEVALAHAVISIPVSADYGSLNLATAVGLVAYEYFQAMGIGHPVSGKTETATQAELHGFFDQLEAALDARNFWKEPKKKPVMWRNLRGVFMRAAPTSQEVRTLRGMLKCLTEFGVRSSEFSEDKPNSEL